jgi:hypothetical protein
LTTLNIVVTPQMPSASTTMARREKDRSFRRTRRTDAQILAERLRVHETLDVLWQDRVLGRQRRLRRRERIRRIDDAFAPGISRRCVRRSTTCDVPNGRMPIAIGSCLVYAIYHSPLPFIRTLLEIGAIRTRPPTTDFHR